jgi:hypothetical protein
MCINMQDTKSLIIDGSDAEQLFLVTGNDCSWIYTVHAADIFKHSGKFQKLFGNLA